jgi:hypothetical protein
MRKSPILIIIVVLLAIIGAYIIFVPSEGPFEPVGRLSFVKLANPDMYPGHPHSQYLAKIAQEKGSKCILVVHYGGSSNYRSYQEGNVYILELAYVEKKQYTPGINWTEVWDEGINGIPKDKWTYRSDGKNFTTLAEAEAYILAVAQEHGQQGPIPLLYHGTVRSGDPLINQGCGFPLYYQLVREHCGIMAAYAFVIRGIIFPYLSLPYRNYEIQNARQLQYYYTHNMLNYE